MSSFPSFRTVFALMFLMTCVAWASPAGAVEPAHPYPGSVEHQGMTGSRGDGFYAAQSLVQRYVFHEHEGALPGPITAYDEPEVNYIMAGRRTRRTGETRRTLQVYTMTPGSEAVTWRVGTLPIGTYMMRIIGAIPTEAVKLPPAQLVFQMRINDGLNGETNTYTLRGRGVDSFYRLQEFAFHVVDDRELTLELRLLEESQTQAHLYNLEIHDIFAGTARRAGKTQPGLFTLAEREQARRNFAQTEEGQAMLEQIAQQQPMSPEQRAARDEAIWNSLPPINSMVEENYIPVIGRAPAIHLDTMRTRENPTWFLHHRYGGIHGDGWQKPFAIVHDTYRRVGRHEVSPDEIYTLDDYRRQLPLGDTGDRGWGVLTDETTDEGLPILRSPLIRLVTTALRRAGRNLESDLVDRYHLAGDEQSARDLSMLMVRFAWYMPTYGLTHSVEYATCEADIPWMTRRYYQSKLMKHDFAMTYDKLFPFIDGNEEFAAAVGRFIPWVESPADVIKLLDMHLVQYVAKNMLHGRYYYDNQSANMMLQLVGVQANPEIAEPWMQFLWTRVYYYPYGRQPLPDILSLSSQRDGTSPIGSISYVNTPATDVARLIEPYMRTGGDPKYDLRDFTRYPEAITGAYWDIDSAVAGQWSLNIGDVGGPSITYGTRRGGPEDADLGWRWTRDPRFAWVIVHRIGRTIEPDDEWQQIVDAAATVSNPYLSARSRVLSNWSGILEAGVGDPDFRFHRAAAVRVGWGRGHAHNDGLDLRVYAHGLIMSGDFGQRGSYGKPTHTDTMTHNLVQIDNDQNDGHSWVRTLADMRGVQYLQAEVLPQKPGLLRRQVALIDVNVGTPSAADDPTQDANVITPNSYVFDVFRAQGGSMHTYAFHGNVDDMHFESNVRNRQVLPRDTTPERSALEKSDPEAQYLHDFRWTRPDYMGETFLPDHADWVADAPAQGPLEATWRLSRSAEERMLGEHGAMTEPRKFTRLHLFEPQGLRILHGIVIDKENAARINPDYPHYAGRKIYAQRRGEQGMQSAFAAVIEPYAGEPFIAARRTLEVAPTDRSALRPIAVEVVTTNGRTDLLFADGQPGQLRNIPEAQVSVAGEFAFIARDAEGLVGLSLTSGSQLTAGAVRVLPNTDAYTAKVVNIDYLSRELTLDRALPEDLLIGATVEIGDAIRSTSYEIDAARREGNATVVHLRKSLEILRTRVEQIDDGDPRVIDTSIRIAMAKPGAWVTNAQYSQFWRLENERPITLDRPAQPSDFAPRGDDPGTLIIVSIGPDVTLRLPTHVSLERVTLPAGGQAYAVRSNVPFTLPDSPNAQMSQDGETWQPILRGEAVPTVGIQDTLYLRGL